MSRVYDRIGVGYQNKRRAEPVWERAIHDAIGDGTVLNIGAGSGSYEPRSNRVLAVEPSRTMLDQRPDGAAPCVQGIAEELPVSEGATDVALAVLTVHHWTDPVAGLAELRRVSRRQVVVTWDPVVSAGYWLVTDYLPQIAEHDHDLATLDRVASQLNVLEIVDHPVPADCRDGVMAAYWRRPEAYLDPSVRASISSLSLLDQDVVEEAMGRLADDLDTGAWAECHADLLDREELDRGYRLVVSES